MVVVKNMKDELLKVIENKKDRTYIENNYKFKIDGWLFLCGKYNLTTTVGKYTVIYSDYGRYGKLVNKIIKNKD